MAWSSPLGKCIEEHDTPHGISSVNNSELFHTFLAESENAVKKTSSCYIVAVFYLADSSEWGEKKSLVGPALVTLSLSINVP